MPDYARDQHGNLAEQVRGGPVKSEAVGARSGPELAKAAACTACHGVSERIVGPGFREIGARYAGDTGAAARLAAKLKAGGGGIWGSTPMPPQPQLKDADARTLVQWILGGARQ
jgi:cytochrome c